MHLKRVILNAFCLKEIILLYILDFSTTFVFIEIDNLLFFGGFVFNLIFFLI